jgi:hypothetical protein
MKPARVRRATWSVVRRRDARLRRALIALVSLAAFLLGTVQASADPVELLPNLGMARLGHFTIDTTTLPGRKLLRFTAIIVNNGAGPLELSGSRPDTASPMTVTQRIYEDDGSYIDVPTAASMVYAGDGHDHWHVENLESYVLTYANGSTTLRRGAKVGFCFRDSVAHDLSLPGAPQTAVYTYARTCARNQPEALAVLEGLSVGWGDRYAYSVAYQWIDVTGLADGTYRVRAVAEPKHLFSETSTTDNVTWTIVRVTGDSVTVVKQGPSS